MPRNRRGEIGDGFLRKKKYNYENSQYFAVFYAFFNVFKVIWSNNFLNFFFSKKSMSKCKPIYYGTLSRWVFTEKKSTITENGLYFAVFNAFFNVFKVIWSNTFFFSKKIHVKMLTNLLWNSFASDI